MHNLELIIYNYEDISFFTIYHVARRPIVKNKEVIILHSETTVMSSFWPSKYKQITVRGDSFFKRTLLPWLNWKKFWWKNMSILPAKKIIGCKNKNLNMKYKYILL